MLVQVLSVPMCAECSATADVSFERSGRIILDATRAPRQLDTSAIPPAASRGS